MAKKKKPATEVVLQLDKRFKIPSLMVFTLLLIFFGSMMLALSFALITELEHQINAVRAEISTQRDDNLALRSGITQKYTLDEVKEIAEGRLGMFKPDRSQIIEIYVPKESYTELNLGDEQEDEPLWQVVWAFFQRIFKGGEQ
jgi:cell division protein FtsB